MNSTIRTFCSDKPLDFTEISEDVRAFIATGYQNGTLLMTSVNKVPAGTGILLKGRTGTYDIPILETETTDNIASNMLVGVNADTYVSTTSDNYLNYHYVNDGNISYFTVIQSTQVIEGGTAYLRLPASLTIGAKRVNIGFSGDNATGINTLKTTETDSDNAYYTVAGVKVDKPSKGIYIHNGKKVYVK
jgi:hypothetical protein